MIPPHPMLPCRAGVNHRPDWAHNGFYRVEITLDGPWRDLYDIESTILMLSQLKSK
jgi:hypothetical protein